jgi:hypothetical protein
VSAANTDRAVEALLGGELPRYTRARVLCRLSMEYGVALEAIDRQIDATG